MNKFIVEQLIESSQLVSSSHGPPNRRCLVPGAQAFSGLGVLIPVLAAINNTSTGYGRASLFVDASGSQNLHTKGGFVFRVARPIAIDGRTHELDGIAS